MGMVYADVELINYVDLEMVRRGHIDIDEVRRMPVNIMVDIGSFHWRSMKAFEKRCT